MTIHDIGTDPLSPAMTITPEQVVQWAREASVWIPMGSCAERDETISRLQEFARLAHEAGCKAGLEEAAAECGAFNTIEGIAQNCAAAIRERAK